MHEYSVVSSLIALCEEHAKKNQAHKIERVVVGIGERSAMDKSLFVSAFETFREESLVCKDAVLDIVDEKVELECKDCLHVFKPNALDYGVCEKCHSKNVVITQGNEMRLLSLEMLAE
ncbi:hydrogenase/urease nickel incorporation protein HypA [Helicobacter pylori]|uniref:hydrogenase/urease nickel incorporation protein HypA n=1 Tax=Helicobacter pylori TaxID=210 RepID=UPI0015D889E9|nr:hydrogenase/urease nickel incorporation protein HypA [Helicobacter pylori]UOR38309.1 hydrogenase/urease nickel incorporation protein HypA [Helicobacter pylori]UOS11102.1 hydrogenase/urease nickel incorporation protein HypA [Helicobacter pylori]UOS48940.1 hydrogenase/urease nickel incorporation protein HypA [Helicobacter pylori]WRA55611.1 hydrogenase/urease nickel incorporation protein HypA [Helicobacter pylori]WRC67850.1 hydrogenase/urease nickel incorporation protein HypA [Helicobacter pyl